MYLSLSQTVKAVMNTQHGMTLDEAHPNCCTDSSVHTSTGSSDVHNSHIDVTLAVRDREKEVVKEDVGAFELLINSLFLLNRSKSLVQ